MTRTEKFEKKFKEYIGAVTSWVEPKATAVTDGYTAQVNALLSWLLTIIGLLLAAYVVLLVVHFRLAIAGAARKLVVYINGTRETARLIEPEPKTESRVEKMIGPD